VEEVLPRWGRSRAAAIGAYQRFVQEGLGERHRTDLYEVVDQRYLGDEAFVEGVEKRVGTDERPRCVEMRWGEIQEAVCRRLSVSLPAVLHRGHGGVRQICW
jgi:hypothetical protein